MRFQHCIQWLLIFSLLPIYTLWVLRADNRTLELTVAHAMELRESAALLELPGRWSSRDVCAVTREEAKLLRDRYDLRQETIAVNGEQIIVLRFREAVPARDELTRVLARDATSGLACLPVQEFGSPWTFAPALS